VVVLLRVGFPEEGSPPVPTPEPAHEIVGKCSRIADHATGDAVRSASFTVLRTAPSQSQNDRLRTAPSGLVALWQTSRRDGLAVGR